MKALLVITGRGIGGDAVVGLNVIKALESKGIECEIALDKNAPGLLYKKKGYSWHKVSIPQAGGHAASKLSALKAGLRTITASFKTMNLIRKVKPDIVVGIIGGGAVIGSLSSKLARTKCVSLINTPLDTKVCSKLNECIILPENNLFKTENLDSKFNKTFFPINPNIDAGNYENGIKEIEKHISSKNDDNIAKFDKDKKTILFSSGSSLFEGTVKALKNFVDEYGGQYNILLVGDPLKKEYLEMVDETKVINLGYINWISDCYAISDLAVLTDDGNMVQESIVCNLPVITLTRVKYGRYHNIASIYEGIVFESEIDTANDIIINTLNNIDSIKTKMSPYKKGILESNDKISEIIIRNVKNP